MPTKYIDVHRGFALAGALSVTSGFESHVALSGTTLTLKVPIMPGQLLFFLKVRRLKLIFSKEKI